MIYLNGNPVLTEHFPNGEIIPEVTPTIENNTKNTVYLEYRGSEDFLSLMFLKEYLDKKNAKARLIISYLPYGRMDRVKGDQIFTLKVLTNFINSLCFDRVYVLDPHSDVSIALLNNAKEISVTDVLIQEAVCDIKVSNIHYVLPDAGAAKRYKIDSDKILVANKDRDFATGKINNISLHAEVENPEVAIIIDDICSYGGTFIGLSKILREKGFKKVFLVVTHAEDSIFKGSLFEHVDMVYTTNSILATERYWENQKFNGQLNSYSVRDLYFSGSDKDWN